MTYRAAAIAIATAAIATASAMAIAIALLLLLVPLLYYTMQYDTIQHNNTTAQD